jgi:5-methylcytosine-specific restriction endonuclease McrA
MSLYNYRWQQARLRFLRENPLCAMCLKRCPPIIEASSVVDHVIPHRGDPELFWDESNWQALSKRCHDSRKASIERGDKIPPHSSWDASDSP